MSLKGFLVATVARDNKCCMFDFLEQLTYNATHQRSDLAMTPIAKVMKNPTLLEGNTEYVTANILFDIIVKILVPGSSQVKCRCSEWYDVSL